MQETAQTFTTEERVMINRVLDLQNLTVRATAVVNGNVTLTHEIKINVNIAK